MEDNMEIVCYGYNPYDLEEYVQIREHVVKEAKSTKGSIVVTDQPEDDRDVYDKEHIVYYHLLEGYKVINQNTSKTNKEMYDIKTKYKEIHMFKQITKHLKDHYPKIVVVVNDIHLRTPEDELDKQSIEWYGHYKFRKLLDLLFTNSTVKNFGELLGYEIGTFDGRLKVNRCYRTNPDDIEFLPIKYKTIQIEKRWYFSSSGELIFGNHKDADLNLKESIDNTKPDGRIVTNQEMFDAFIQQIRDLDREQLKAIKSAYVEKLDHWKMNCTVADFYGVDRKEGDSFDKVKYYEKCVNYVTICLKDGKSFRTLKNLY